MAVESSVVAAVREPKDAAEAGRSESLKASRLPQARPELAVLASEGEPVPLRRRELQACIAWLLDAGTNNRIPLEKRAHRRYPFRRPLTVTPVNNHSGRPDHLKSFAAFGIDISSCGICFVARQLVPARKAVLSMEGPGSEIVALLFEPRWVRFTRGGWYQTGGRLLEVLPEEKEMVPVVRLIEAPPDVDELYENPRHSHRKPL